MGSTCWVSSVVHIPVSMETDSSAGRAIWTQPQPPNPQLSGISLFFDCKAERWSTYLLYGEAKMCWSPEILSLCSPLCKPGRKLKRTPLVSCGIRRAVFLLRGYKCQRGTHNSNKKIVFLENSVSCPIVKGTTSQLQT